MRKLVNSVIFLHSFKLNQLRSETQILLCHLVKMPSTKSYLFHPYQKPFLHFYGTNFLSDENHPISDISEIDLYDQPVPDPYIAITFSIIMLIQVCIGEYLHWKVFWSLKQENSVIKHIAQIFTISQMIFWPLTIFLISVTNFIYPLNELIGSWFCTIVVPINTFLSLVIFSHSFLSSLMRYLLIVHSEKVEAWGKEKVKKLFVFLAVLLPLLITFWKEVDGSELHPISYVNKCYGKHERVFLVETSTLNVLKKSFCAMETYDEGDPIALIVAMLKQLFCAASTITIIVMGSNLSEGIIYYRLFSYMVR